MADSRRLIQGNRTPYRSAAIDAALGREAHREQSGGQRATRANANTATAGSGGLEGREAHLETLASATPRGTVSAGALQRLEALLRRDENLARKLAKNPRRALAAVDFMSDRDKQLLGGIDKHLLKQLADASDNFQVAVSKRAMAGLADAPLSVGGGYDPAADNPLGIGLPQGKGIDVGGGVVVHSGAGGGGYWNADGDAVPGGAPGAGFPGQGGPPVPGFGAQGYDDGYGVGTGISSYGTSPNIPLVVGNPNGPTASPSNIRSPGQAGSYDRERDVVAHGDAIPTSVQSPTSWDTYWNVVAAAVQITGGLPAQIAAGASVGGAPGAGAAGGAAAPPPPPAPDGPTPAPDTAPAPGPPPPPDGNIPNDSDTRGPRRAGPRSVEALPSSISRGGDAMPNLEGTGSPRPVGPAARGLYLPSGRTAIPNDEATSPIRPHGPRSRSQSRASTAVYRGDAMPNPDADPGRGGPSGPAA